VDAVQIAGRAHPLFGLIACRGGVVWPLLLCGPACAQGSSDAPSGIEDGSTGEIVEAGGVEEAGPQVEAGATASEDGGDPPIVADDGSAGGNDAAPPPDALDAGGLPGDSSLSDAPLLDGAPDDASLSDGAPCGCGSQSVCTLGTCTAARRVFVSNETYDGALGGHAGADATCQSLATAASLGGNWMAWISDATSSPSVRFSKSSVGYYLLDGTLLAANWADLTSSGLTRPIDLSETRVSLASASADASKTWTATLFTGALGTASCSDFGSSAATVTGEVGHCTGTGTENWTSAYATEECSVQNHLYCFEQ
jgi:hypothetical protein